MLQTDIRGFEPQPIPSPVVGPGEFVIAASHLDHNHIYGMCEALRDAGATVKWVFDPDPAKVEAFAQAFPGIQVARSEEEILDDPQVYLVAGAGITSERCPFGIKVMDAGKDYFCDKAPMTTLEQVDQARATTVRTGRKYSVYYSERINVEAAVLAGQLIEQGAIGRVIQFIGLGPHRLGPMEGRPDWFYIKDLYGGILCDIGSHNFEQMLYYTGSADAQVLSASIGNFGHPTVPQLDDFGDCHAALDTGASGYFRVDWFTPPGLSNWGDGRTFLLGTDGYIEMRKYVNIATGEGPGHVFVVDQDGEHHINAVGHVGFPYFGQLIKDCLERTDLAMPQEHAFKAAELSIKAQLAAQDLTGRILAE